MATNPVRRSRSDRIRFDSEEYSMYLREMLNRMRRDMERRRLDNEASDVDQNIIQVQAVEMYARSNAKDHNTNMYDIVEGKEPSVVLRRGLPFYVAIRFTRPYDPDKDRVRLEFAFGPKIQLSKGSLVYLPVTSNQSFTLDKSKWDIRLHHHESNVITLHVQVPATVGVGLWRMKIVSLHSSEFENKPPVEYECKENIYILFNPWLKDDAVYMENEDWRNEYVLNEVGKIYVGNYRQPRGRRWIYGQFSDAVLPASVFLLEKTNLDYIARGNPIKVCRAISAMVNFNDDDQGVVVGKWQAPYDDGTAPWVWTGSVSILEKYLNSGGEPVKYGQCWVFGGVLASVCRALGIPTRTITNFVSAHDTNDTLTVDKIFDEEGLEIPGFDSIWNYHVWNECWMTRPDLPTGYGGWQVLDATPQETSDGIYRAGPASLVAVRRGEINQVYDCPFVFSEVNADIVHWKEDKTLKFRFRKIMTNKYHVGRLIVTKKVGVDDDVGEGDMEDVMDQYKRKEGTREERMAILNAARSRISGRIIFDIPEPEKEDVLLDLEDIESVMIGKPFRVVVNVENKSDEKRTVSAVLSASSIYYTGIIASAIKRSRGNFVLQPRQKEVLAITITEDDYYDKLVEYCNVKIYALATVQETNQAWSEEDDFVVNKPNLQLATPEKLKVGESFNLDIHFTNPLERVLRICTITIEGPGLTNPRKVDFRNVGAGESIVHTESLTPRKVGPRKIVVVFNSNELVDIVGSKQVEISE